MITGIAIHGTN